jgi:Cytochrome c oxidase subunit Vb
MFKGLQRAFSLVNRTGFVRQPSRGLFNFRSILDSLKAQYDHAIEPGDARSNPNTLEMSETELFDEDAHEVQAMVTNNTFDLEIMMGDTNPQRNFGTIDNPVLIFSANVGWRYVMCTGLNEEDEGLSHVGVWFILREGPMHRCAHCGQCFKLVNLKDEISEENDYYLEHYMPILEEEMGDDDELVTRFTFHKFAEPYPCFHPAQNSNFAYVLVNADDHDRILTDPAYRMQRLQEGHETLQNFHLALIEIEDRLLWQRGGYYPAIAYTKAEYEDLITSELAIRKLDRVFNKVLKFEKRAILEPEDHERREKRMIERARVRTLNFTKYVGTNEKEQMYNDYFETDADHEEELISEQDDYERLFASGIFDFKNYEFVEEDTDGVVPVVESVFQQKIFKFKHRKWNEDPSRHFIRESRMIRRYLERMRHRDPEIELDSKSTSDRNFMINYSKLQRYVVEESVQQYKDYYESDEDDIKDLEFITPDEQLQFAEIFKDYSRPLGDFKAIISVAPREYDKTKSWLDNLREHYKDLRTRVLPTLDQQIREVADQTSIIGKAQDFQLASGTYEVMRTDDLSLVFEDNLNEVQSISAAPQVKGLN